MSSFRERLANRNLLVDLLVMLFGMGSWLGVSSIYLELPLIIRTAPEEWSLPSYIVTTVQLGNIATLLYLLFQKFSPRKLNDGYLIYVVFAIGCSGAICIAFFYDRTFFIAGEEHSVLLFICTAMFSTVACLSSVLFMPYMGRFRDIYLVTYLLGQSLNGSFPSIIALIQGVGGTLECIANNSTDGPPFIKYIPPPLFVPTIYFIFVFALLATSGFSFVLLNNLGICRREYATGTIQNGNEYHYDSTKQADEDQQIPENVRNLSKFNYVYLFVIETLVCVTGNGMIPGLQSFSCLPYGNTAYHLAATLSSIINPFACFLANFLPHTSIRHITIQTVIAGAVIAYLFLAALMSPFPPLVGTTLGAVIIVSWTDSCWIPQSELIFLPIAGVLLPDSSRIDDVHPPVDHYGVPIPRRQIARLCRGRRPTERHHWCGNHFLAGQFHRDLCLERTLLKADKFQ